MLNWHRSEVQREWELLQTVPTHSLIVVNVSGPKDQCSQNGFGVLTRRESDGLLGVLFVHSIYPQHVPENCTSYRVLLGGDRCPAMTSWSDQQLGEYALSSLIKLGLIDTANRETQKILILRWPKAIGLADRGHDERLKSLWRIQAYCPGIYFGGIYTKGVGVADALQSAQDCFTEWKQSSAH
jgi:protoporphyrinogen oxidase